MKLNTRHYACIAAMASSLVIAGVAQAQSLSFYWTDTSNHNLDGTIVGVGLAHTDVTVQLWLNTNINDSTQNLMIGYGTSNTRGLSATRTDPGYVSFADTLSAGTVVTSGSTGLVYSNATDGSALTIGPDCHLTGSSVVDQRGGQNINNNQSGSRPWGLQVVNGWLSGGSYQPTGPELMYTVTLSVQFTAFGQSQDVTVWDAGNGATGTTYLAQGSNQYRPGNGTTFTIKAVPEPTTMLALGAGLIALAARRRRK